MKENNFNNNLANMSEVFNNKTFRYRINGFAHACRMDDVGVVERAGVLFTSNAYDETKPDEHSYFIAVNENNEGYGKTVTLSGNYDDLFFTFINQYENQNLDKRIVDLPFFISLTKKIDEETYQLTIESDGSIKTKFMIDKSREFKDRSLRDKVVFYANVMDFSKILKIVKAFVYNPRLGFDTYNTLMQQQKIVFTNNMLDKMVMQDESLDKPMGPVKKLMNKIIK